MNDRRKKRSTDRSEALQYLVESLNDRSDARAVALIDEGGRIVAGVGMPRDLRDLATLGGDLFAVQANPRFDTLTDGTDYLACEVRAGGAKLFLVALGERLRKLPDALRAATRICAAA